MAFRTEASGPPSQPLADTWIFDRIAHWVASAPDRPAFILDRGERNDEFTFSNVDRHMRETAAGLAAAGIQPGERIAILMENVPHWAFAFLGAMRLGAITVPLSTMLGEASIRLLAEHAGVRLLFTDESNAAAALAAAPPDCAIVILGNARERGRSWADFVAAGAGHALPAVPADGESTAVIMYTSGTTGDPKGVELTYRNFNHEVMAMVEAFDLKPAHRILSVLPFSHVLPLIGNSLGPLCIGATVVFLHSISPQRIVESFQKHRISLFVCVPQFFYVLHKRILGQVESQPLPMRWLFAALMAISRRVANVRFRRLLFSRVHRKLGEDLALFASGGSKFDPQIAEDLQAFGYTMLQAYGLTETSAAATATPPAANRIGSVGRPIRGVSVRIDSPNEEGIGEVLIRGPVVMKGYYQDPQHTRDSMTDGWFRSGDLGYLDADGNLFITGRIKDVIVLASGKNVYPEELEHYFQQIPLIKEICVLGVAGSSGPEGEVLHAVIVPDMDEFRRTSQTAILESIRFEIESSSKRLPSYQRVHSISIRNEPFPRTATRKLKRFEILQDETKRKTAAAHAAGKPDDVRFTHGVGAVLAELIRQAKPETATLQPGMNLELDLGFDSLGRVELMGGLESRLGISVDEKQMAQIFLLGELLDLLESSGTGRGPRGRSWREIIGEVSPESVLDSHILQRKMGMYITMYCLFRVASIVGRILFHLRARGTEKLPDPPYMLCPNHESFLDAFVILTVLPFRSLRHFFSLGYSDYFETGIMRRLGRWLNVVSVDMSVNLIRAMQAGAAGLKRGKVLCIFPEGTRSIDGRVGEFKKGAAILSAELGIQIVPVGVRGAYEVWPRAGGFRLHPIEVVFGDPIDPRNYAGSSDPYTAITNDLRETVIRLSADGPNAS